MRSPKLCGTTWEQLRAGEDAHIPRGQRLLVISELLPQISAGVSEEALNIPWAAIGQRRANKVSMAHALADGSSRRARRLLADRWRSVGMFNRVILAWEYPSEHHAAAPGYHVLPAVKLIGDGGSLHRGSCSRVP